MTKMTPPVRDGKSSGRAGRDGLDRALVKRFYKSAAVVEKTGFFHVEIDGKPVRTPGRAELAVERSDLADALCAEWNAQGEWIDPQSMPFTQFVNTSIDRVSVQMDGVRDSILAFAGSDLLCYRAETPKKLADLQSAAWDPVLDWLKSEYGATFEISTGVMPVVQSSGAVEKINQRLKTYDAFGLSGLHVLTSLMGSVFLALAVAEKRLEPEAAWSAAHVDEDWQIAQWGGDAEAETRRARRLGEMLVAARFIAMSCDHAQVFGTVSTT